MSRDCLEIWVFAFATFESAGELGGNKGKSLEVTGGLGR